MKDAPTLPQPPADQTFLPQISVIICTYNREKYLQPLLLSILEQDYPPESYEILLIDNNSTDHTQILCQSFLQSHPKLRLRYFLEPQQGLSHARNRGIAESHAPLLFYVDDDATLFPHSLRAYDLFFRSHPDILAAGGPIIPRYEAAPPPWLTRFTKELLTGYLYRGDQAGFFSRGKYPGGGNACYRNCFFDRFGSFNPSLGRKGDNLIGAEEKDLFHRYLAAGHAIGYVPQAGIFHHIPPAKLTRAHLRRLSHGIGLSERIRTRSAGPAAFLRRLLSESFKWAATLFLLIFYSLRFQATKGLRLLEFRYYVTKGLLGR